MTSLKSLGTFWYWKHMWHVLVVALFNALFGPLTKRNMLALRLDLTTIQNRIPLHRQHSINQLSTTENLEAFSKFGNVKLKIFPFFKNCTLITNILVGIISVKTSNNASSENSIKFLKEQKKSLRGVLWKRCS